MIFRCCLLTAGFISLGVLSAGPAEERASWGTWVEPKFPFFSTVLDARREGDRFPADNLTPRGLVLNLGNNLWACFDTDLLRIACLWIGSEGEPPVTLEGLAPGSYHVAGQKTRDGQDHLPKPVGTVLLANGIYPGWQVGAEAAFTDPRKPAPSPEEVGRGPLDGATFRGVKIPLRLRHDIDGVPVVETFRAGTDGATVERRIEVGPHPADLQVVIGRVAPGVPLCADGVALRETDGVAYVSLPASETTKKFSVRIGPGTEFADPPRARWTETVTTRGAPSPLPEAAYVMEEIPLPLDNPWRRNVRLADLGFFAGKPGEAAAVTFDGDVWLISGLNAALGNVSWKRFASGLLEPMSLVVREDEVFVFDRHGIWRLTDRDGDGECEVYEMFSNRFAQTAETREFPNSMDLGPDGSFVLSKGGQAGATLGKDNGTVLRVSPDGKTVTTLGHGLRQPFIGVDPLTGLVTASDQQGNYVPSTPLHVIRDNRFYGHLPGIMPEEQYPAPIEEPAAWIPHPVNPSGVTQVWLRGARMGPLNDECLHIGYNRPELFRVLFNDRFERPQATVTGFWREFRFPPLNGTVNPADGQLYLTGFQVWGTTAEGISGLARLRYTGAPRVLLKECTPMDQGVLLRFTDPLDPHLATDPASYSSERWNYRRTAKYGSPHLKPDGEPGQEWMTPSSAYLSQDRRSVFVGIPGMRAGVHQMRIGWGLRSADGDKAENTAYFSPWDLLPFDPVREGFGSLTVDLTPRPRMAAAAGKASAEEGERLSQMMGCMACHSTDGTMIGKVGPSWKGLHGMKRPLAKGGTGEVIADERYLRESILDPGAKVVKGFEKFDAGMPIYEGILNEAQVQSLVLYIKTL